MQALPRCARAHPAATATLGLRRSVVRPETRKPSPYVCRSCSTTSSRPFSSSRRCNNDNNDHAPASSFAPPSSGYTALPTRRVISLAGHDAAKFLQGMITSNISALTTMSPARPAGFYTAFLHSTGRVLHDVFVYSNMRDLGDGVERAPSFLIECDDANVGVLMQHLKKYRIRSKFKFRVLDRDECTQGKIVLRDPRSPTMGMRILGDGTSGPPLVQAEPSDPDAYQIRRYLNGVAEGTSEIRRDMALPLESNMDVMGGIDFRKGCYLGQELTIRTKHRGVVRKRILPVLLYGGHDAAPEKLEYKPSLTSTPLTAAEIPRYAQIGRAGGTKGRAAGTFLGGVGNLGLGLCRLQTMTDVQLPGEAAEAAPFDPSTELLVQWGAMGEPGSTGAHQIKAKAFVPEWLRSKLNEGNGEASHS
ncbi:uncharacterized protein PG998_005959 [Apiospora kogelbergensis]|uniref:uncharacterized protein n=1 Tax=Apiospora kogelbergensis TaxID=1337665 RepID=UPI0031301FF5